MAASSEMLCAMAALVLKDGQKEVTGDNISKILKSVDAEVEAYWPKLFATALEGVDIEALMTAVGAAPAAAPAAAGGAPAAAAPAEEPKKEEKEEESDEEMGFSLFD